MNVIKRMIIPIDKHLDRVSAAVRTGSTTDVICITLTEAGKVYLLDGVSMAAVRCTKPDGRQVYNACVIKDNEILYTVTTQTTAMEGTVDCELELFDDAGGKSVSARFELKVFGELYPDDVIESQNEYGTIQELLREASDTNDYASRMAGQASHSASEASESAASALASEEAAYGSAAAAESAKDAAVGAAGDALGYKEAASSYAETAEGAKDLAERYAGAAGQYAGDAAGAMNAAISAKEDAEDAKDAAVSAKEDAESAAESAEGYKDDALSYAGRAETACGSAEGYASSAEAYAGAAEDAKDAAQTAAGDAEDAKTAAQQAMDSAAYAAFDARSSKVDAQNAASSAGNYASSAEGYKNDALSYAGRAETACGSAEGYASSAEAYAGAAEEARDAAVAASEEAVSVVEDTAKQVARNEAGISNIVSGHNLDITHEQTCLFDGEERTFEKVREFADKGIYLLLFNNGNYQEPMPAMYTNTGILCALTNTTSATAQRFNSSITKDRTGINVNAADRRNALWMAESYNGSSTQFTLRNLESKQYLRNNGGNIAYVDSATSGCVWTLKNLTGEGFIFTALSPMNDSTKYLRISNGSGVFKFGSTSNDTDGRNANLYLYKCCADQGETYTVDLSNTNTVSGNSQRSIDSDGNLVITSTGAGHNTVIKPPLTEICKLYKKVTVRYTKTSGTFAYKYHRLLDPTSDPQNDYKWGTGDEYKFPSSSNTREVTFDTAYLPVDEFVIFDWNVAGVITIHSIIYSEPRWIGHDYCMEPVLTDDAAKSIRASCDCDSDFTVYATNDAGASSPTWENITEAVKNKSEHTFTNEPSSGYGIAVRGTTLGNFRALSYMTDRQVGETYEDATTTEHGLMSASDKSKLNGIAAHARKVNFTDTLSSGTKIANVQLEDSTEGWDFDMYVPRLIASALISGLGMSTKYNPSSSDIAAGCIKSNVYLSGTGGTTVTISNNDVTISSPDTFVGSGSSAAKGLVPKPPTTAGTSKYLCEDGTWKTPPDTTYSDATSSSSGLMSSTDKSKFDNLTTYQPTETVIGTYNDGTNDHVLYRRVITETIDQSRYDGAAYGFATVESGAFPHIVKAECHLNYYISQSDITHIEQAEQIQYQSISIAIKISAYLASFLAADSSNEATGVLIIEYYK